MEICDHQNNSVKYKNKNLFAAAGHRISIHNFSISNYIIKDERNYPIAGITGSFNLDHGSFMSISSVTSDVFFDGNEGIVLQYCYLSNISAKMIVYVVSKNTFNSYIFFQ